MPIRPSLDTVLQCGTGWNGFQLPAISKRLFPNRRFSVRSRFLFGMAHSMNSPDSLLPKSGSGTQPPSGGELTDSPSTSPSTSPSSAAVSIARNEPNPGGEPSAELVSRLPKIVHFRELCRCGDEVWIENEGQLYRLRRTRQGKLILTK
jgi:hemin uptake protein HemP